ncbi:MAG: 16S rRNA (guanine(966)-N(2))-methyltransferase RsmD [Kiritimatiellae bacterium]|nr:16S rRNA (guanine(966)-N(2))-methyltransferase RsmD [Kiritimatiellia bacterium]
MRITGGQHGGRLLHAPATGLRPTQDRVRAALYSALAPVVPGAHVLDLFAGTGALGLEAWSRGAAAVDFVESAPATLRVLHANCAALRLRSGTSRILGADVFRVLAAPPRLPAAPYDIVLADPPYELARRHAYLPRLAELLLQNNWLPALPTPSFFVFETDDPTPPPPLPSFQLIFHRTYGTTRLLIFRRQPPAALAPSPSPA